MCTGQEYGYGNKYWNYPQKKSPDRNKRKIFTCPNWVVVPEVILRL